MFDYKSIALPAELQGHFVSCEVFTAKHQLNQCIKNNMGVRCLLAAHLNCDGKLLNVTDLSAWSRYGNPASHKISKACFHPLKITKKWSGKMKKIFMFLLSFLFINITSQVHSYDATKYAICYGEMTNAHKARGLHKSNRTLSIQIKETVCKSYANGEHDSYEGKQ